MQNNDLTLIEVKANKQPVAIYIKERNFVTHKIKLYKNDVLYTFSDGFPDQLGGESKRKYVSKNFKKLLLEISQKPMNEQKTILNKTLEYWRNGYEQIDDILVTGIKITQ